MATETDSRYHAGPVLDFSSLVTDSTSSAAMAPEHFSMTGAEHANLKPSVLWSLFSANHNSDATDMGTYGALNGEGECTCHAGVTELLASMRRRGNSNDQRLSLDAQLAKLKQCIVSSETSMGCAHGREDSEPIHIMAIALLIGYVIDDFKVLASEPSPAPAAEMTTLGNAERGSHSMSSRAATPSSTNMSLGGLIEPRLSWGVLELEEEDEMELRQRLYLLSFRKLERLLSQLTQYLQDLHNAWAGLPDPSQHTAFMIACDYTRLWLEKKAGNVRRLFSVHASDETVDSAFT
ncbi:MAG: hypothetical protein L6R40_001760 [Gallowayella cf. fulva]|nr:MAG: hypothetical protein L6R40_001760 [Xanthomendoza cf. fulva]